MGWSAAAAIAATVITATSSYIQSQAQNRQAEYQSAVARANAEALRNQAEVERLSGIAQKEAVELKRSELTKQYRSQQGSNISLLAASGVDVGSSSAQDLLTGNAIAYASDVGENAYQAQLTQWESDYKRKNLLWQADVQDAQASYLSSTVSGLGTSLLTAGLSGAGAGLGTYAAFGGGNPFASTSGKLSNYGLRSTAKDMLKVAGKIG